MLCQCRVLHRSLLWRVMGLGKYSHGAKKSNCPKPRPMADFGSRCLRNKPPAVASLHAGAEGWPPHHSLADGALFGQVPSSSSESRGRRRKSRQLLTPRPARGRGCRSSRPRLGARASSADAMGLTRFRPATSRRLGLAAASGQPATERLDRPSRHQSNVTPGTQ